MLKKINYLIIFLCFAIQINLYAELQGSPGEVFPVKVEPNKTYKNLTVDIDGSMYELVALPFSKQGEYIKVGGKNIYNNYQAFSKVRVYVKYNWFVVKDNKVGIGMTSPDHLLHVNGNARIGKGGGSNVAVPGGDRYLKISGESEANNAAVYLGCCHDENGAHKTAIIAENISNWSRSNNYWASL